MKIVVTLGDLLDHSSDAFEELGLNPWCINEGLASSDDEITLTEEQAKRYGFISRD